MQVCMLTVLPGVRICSVQLGWFLVLVVVFCFVVGLFGVFLLCGVFLFGGGCCVVWLCFGCFFFGEVGCICFEFFFSCLMLFQVQVRDTGEALQRTFSSWYIPNGKCTVPFLEANYGRLWSRWWVRFSELVLWIYFWCSNISFRWLVFSVSLIKTDWRHSKAVSPTVLVRKQCGGHKWKSHLYID